MSERTNQQLDVHGKLDELLSIVRYDREMIEAHEHRLAQLTDLTNKIVHLFEGSLGSRGMITKIELIDQKMTEISESSIRQGIDLGSIKLIMTEDKNTSAAKWKALEDRVATLENWRWLVLGGVGVITFVLTMVFR